MYPESAIANLLFVINLNKRKNDAYDLYLREKNCSKKEKHPKQKIEKMNEILKKIREKHGHIHPDWKVKGEIHAELQETPPYYHFSIEQIVANGFRFEHYLQKNYKSAMEIVEITHPDGIHIMQGQLQSPSDGFVHVQTDTPFVQFYFARNSNRSFYAGDTLLTALQPGQYQGCIFFPKVNTALWTTLPRDEFVEINLSLSLFLSLCPAESGLRQQVDEIITAKKNNVLFRSPIYTSYEQIQLLQDLIDKPSLSKDSLPIYIKSKVLHLLALIIDQFDCLTPNSDQTPQIPPGLLPIIHSAKAILDDEINDPPSIAELSSRLGTNDNYLKKYFKILHQSTIRNYINVRRMQIAKDMLQKNKKPINEISRFLGYKSQAHFSAHFKKHYGMPPKQVKRSK